MCSSTSESGTRESRLARRSTEMELTSDELFEALFGADETWVQLPLDLEILMVCDCCHDAEVETQLDDRLVCYPCAYHLAN